MNCNKCLVGQIQHTFFILEGKTFDVFGCNRCDNQPNIKRMGLIEKRNQSWKLHKEKLLNLERLNRAATPGPWIPKDLGQGLQKNEDISLLIELRNNADMLISDSRSRQHTEEWYAVRFELLRELCEQNNLLTEYCNIAANGVKDIHAPPTYQQQMEMLKFERDKAIEAAKQTSHNMGEMETDLYLKLNTKEDEIESLRDLLQEAVDVLSSQHDPEDNLNMIKKISSVLGRVVE